jgi:hypothetical protein
MPRAIPKLLPSSVAHFLGQGALFRALSRRADVYPAVAELERHGGYFCCANGDPEAAKSRGQGRMSNRRFCRLRTGSSSTICEDGSWPVSRFSKTAAGFSPGPTANLAEGRFGARKRPADKPWCRRTLRSGNELVWFFFREPVWRGLRASSAPSSHRPWRGAHGCHGFHDRLFPNGTPRGGFGNLIALPFQNRPG